MATIHIHRQLNSDTLPELRPLIGKTVMIAELGEVVGHLFYRFELREVAKNLLVRIAFIKPQKADSTLRSARQSTQPLRAAKSRMKSVNAMTPSSGIAL